MQGGEDEAPALRHATLWEMGGSNEVQWRVAPSSMKGRGEIMLRTSVSRIRYVAFVTLLIVAAGLSAQEAKEPAAAPVPAQIVAARKVFISNAGADIVSQSLFKRAGEPDQAYNHFYTAMQTWGRYEIVSSPAEADLVFEIGFAAPQFYNGTLTSYGPHFELRVLDGKTHFLLWSLTEPVDGAFRKATWLKNFDHGLDNLMDDLKKLAAPSVVSGEPSKK
jgi:hypothetical protein